jgi:ribose 5-phosphate isomerase B
LRVIIGSDHGGFALKTDLIGFIRELGHEVVDYGTHSVDPVDYPDIALLVASAVAADPERTLGIMVDGAGIGSAMTANKVPGVRAAPCYDPFTAKNSREHNDANVLTLGGRVTGVGLARDIVKAWLSTPFGGQRHARRIEKMLQIERRFLAGPV